MQTDVASVTMPLAMIKKIDRYLKTTEAEELGLSSRPQLIIMLLRQFFEKHNFERFVLGHEEFENLKFIGIERQDAKVLDKRTRKDIDLIYDYDQKVLRCTKCERSDCLHARFIFALQEYYKQMIEFIDMESIPPNVVKLISYTFK